MVKDINYYKQMAEFYKRKAHQYKANSDRYIRAKKNISNGTKRGLMKAKINNKQIGRKPKYTLKSENVRFVLKSFVECKSNNIKQVKSGEVSATRYMKIVAETCHISVPTIYRLAHKYLNFRGNRKY